MWAVKPGVRERPIQFGRPHLSVGAAFRLESKRMIRIDPDALYNAAEVAKLLKWHPRTIRTAARRLGKPPYSRYFTAEEVKRMALRVAK